jgi:hypothetical protein
VDLQGKYHECRAVENTHRGPPALDLEIVIAAFPPPEAKDGMNAVPLRKIMKHNS